MDRIRYWREKAQYGHHALPPTQKKVVNEADDDTRRAMANSMEVNMEVAALLGSTFSAAPPPPSASSLGGPTVQHMQQHQQHQQHQPPMPAGALSLGLPPGIPGGLPAGMPMGGMPAGMQGLLPPMGMHTFGLLGSMMPNMGNMGQSMGMPNMNMGMMLPPGLHHMMLPQAPAQPQQSIEGGNQ